MFVSSRGGYVPTRVAYWDKGNIIRVHPALYNLIRSFVESSESWQYKHNRPLHISRNTVLFHKHGKWDLYIIRKEYRYPVPEPPGESVTIGYYAILEDAAKKFKIEYWFDNGLLDINGQVQIDTSKEIAAILPYKRVEFARPILTEEVADKMGFYFSLASDYLVKSDDENNS